MPEPYKSVQAATANGRATADMARTEPYTL